MVDAGAAILDVGGESTRPGSERSPADVQIARVVPVIERVAREMAGRAVISIDTTRAAVARAALDAGALIINDISGATDDPPILDLAAQRGAPVVLMHMQGQPATMQVNPSYRNVVAEVRAFLAGRIDAAAAAGIARHRVLLDPGIGFGKNVDHNLELLRRVAEFADLGQPLVLGTSRKGFIGRISGETDPADRLMGTAATVAWCVANRASVVRVHDVEPMARVVRVVRAIQSGWPGSG
jgi:dihydropteroate synthase